MAARTWLALLIAAFAAAAHAQNSVFIDELTSPELAALVRAGWTTALVPIGGTEQSGPHIVLGKHNVRVRVLSGKIAVALGNALVAPVIAYVPEGSVDPPSAHMRFPGTLTIPEATFESVLEYAARSLRASGFRDIVFLGDHGGYQHNEQEVAARLNRAW
jgi:creatinine amidohydrolase/Fe(II)-dependent formamide hydrolase-like protein